MCAVHTLDAPVWEMVLLHITIPAGLNLTVSDVIYGPRVVPRPCGGSPRWGELITVLSLRSKNSNRYSHPVDASSLPLTLSISIVLHFGIWGGVLRSGKLNRAQCKKCIVCLQILTFTQDILTSFAVFFWICAWSFPLLIPITSYHHLFEFLMQSRLPFSCKALLCIPVGFLSTCVLTEIRSDEMSGWYHSIRDGVVL